MRQLGSESGDRRVIAMSSTPEAKDDSLRAGCDASVGKSDPPDRLLVVLGMGMAK
jgi:hypothetical protein